MVAVPGGGVVRLGLDVICPDVGAPDWGAGIDHWPARGAAAAVAAGAEGSGSRGHRDDQAWLRAARVQALPSGPEWIPWVMLAAGRQGVCIWACRWPQRKLQSPTVERATAVLQMGGRRHLARGLVTLRVVLWRDHADLLASGATGNSACLGAVTSGRRDYVVRRRRVLVRPRRLGLKRVLAPWLRIGSRHWLLAQLVRS